MLSSETPPGGAPALQAPPGLQLLPDHAPDLLALGGYRQLEEPARHPASQGGPSRGPCVSLALGPSFGEFLRPGHPVLYHHVIPVVEHLSVSSSVRPGMAETVRMGIGVGDHRPLASGKARGPRSARSGGIS